MTTQQHLKMNIQHLHDVLSGTEAVDSCTAATLTQLTHDIEIAVAQAEGRLPHSDLNQQLEQYALDFSEKHPLLSKAIEEILTTLHHIGV